MDKGLAGDGKTSHSHMPSWAYSAWVRCKLRLKPFSILGRLVENHFMARYNFNLIYTQQSEETGHEWCRIWKTQLHAEMCCHLFDHTDQSPMPYDAPPFAVLTTSHLLQLDSAYLECCTFVCQFTITSWPAVHFTYKPLRYINARGVGGRHPKPLLLGWQHT